MGVDRDRRRIDPCRRSLPAECTKAAPAGNLRRWAGRREPARMPRRSCMNRRRIPQHALLADLLCAGGGARPACRRLIWALLDAWRARAAVARLGDELGSAPPPGKLAAALASGVGDPTLEVVYWAGRRTLRRRARATDRTAEPHPGGAATSFAAVRRSQSSATTPLSPTGRAGGSNRPGGATGRRQRAPAGGDSRSARGAPRLAGPHRRDRRSAGGASSATCTTARSSACSPSCTISAWRSPARTQTATTSSRGYSRPVSR